MPIWVSALISVIEWAVEKFGLPFIKQEMQKAEDNSHAQAEDKLKNAQTEDQIKDATKDLANHP